MDIKISHNWLKEYLETKVSPKEIGEKLALSGPSVERVTKVGTDYIYDIEITTNRVDSMSIMGIAREASAIIQNSKLKNKQSLRGFAGKKGKDLLKINADSKLVKRVMAVVMEVSMTETPKLIKERLETAGMRSLNSIVDVTNYVMQEIGHPTHVFDYDLIKNGELNFRLSKKGENIVTFDGKTHELPGGDIVIDDKDGNIIDLPGIIGLKNSVVNENTTRIIFFIDNNDKDRIRRTSTRLGIRTNAAILNEKGVDPELASIAFQRGIELYTKICNAKVISRIYDIYPTKHKTRTINTSHAFIERIIGIPLQSSKVVEILQKLGFGVQTKKDSYFIKVPSWRAEDVTIPEDIVEEVARIYGYQNMPSELPTGKLPEPIVNSPFKFESKIKDILKSHGGYEVYTNSLVGKDLIDGESLQLRNPLGDDTKYLRTSLKQSLLAAIKENKGEKEPFYLFEVSNVYLSTPLKAIALPKEIMTLGIIFVNYAEGTSSAYDFRHAKGIVEGLMNELNISNMEFKLEKSGSYFYFEIDIETLRKNAKEFKTFKPISKYPSQIEDVTFQFTKETKVGEVISKIKKSNSQIVDVQLTDSYEDYFTFRVWYQNPKKTLKDKEVEKIRNGFLKIIREKHGGVVKS